MKDEDEAVGFLFAKAASPFAVPGTNRSGALVERLRLAGAALGLVQQRQIVE